jgi:hypothetical protein
MTESIKRSSLLEIYEALAAVKNNLREVLHKYTAASLRKQLEVLVEPIVEQRNEVEKGRPKEYDEERETMCRSMAAKDENGHPIISGQQFMIEQEKQAEFTAALAALREKHKEKIEVFEAEAKKFNDFLKGDIEFPALKFKIKLSWFNQNVDQQHLEILMPLIDADLEVVEAMTKSKDEPKAAK